jgi:hypothetical protein
LPSPLGGAVKSRMPSRGDDHAAGRAATVRRRRTRRRRPVAPGSPSHGDGTYITGHGDDRETVGHGEGVRKDAAARKPGLTRRSPDGG